MGLSNGNHLCNEIIFMERASVTEISCLHFKNFGVHTKVFQFLNASLDCLLNVYHESVTLLLSINKIEGKSDQGNTEVINKFGGRGKDMSWTHNFEYTYTGNIQGG